MKVVSEVTLFPSISSSKESLRQNDYLIGKCTTAKYSTFKQYCETAKNLRANCVFVVVILFVNNC